MTQGERVKMVRDKAQLTMEQFGNRIGGVSKSTISNIENDNRNLTEHMLKSICREFDVNEKWLKTGEGDMPRKLSEEEEVASLSAIYWKTGEIIHFSELSLRLYRRIMNFLRPARRCSRKPVRS